MNAPQKSPITLLLAGLLAANLGLLWVQGAQLNRQHQVLTQIHSDIQDLADSMDAYTNGDNGDQGDGTYQDKDGNVWAPARHRPHASHALVRARYQDPDAAPSNSSTPAHPAEQDQMDQGLKDIQDTKKANLDAVAKARDDQEKLSISENYRKGQEERKIQEAQYAWTRWVWLGLGVLVLVFLGRAWVIKRGQ